MNLELMKEGFLPVVWPVEMRLPYYEALDYAHTKNDYSLFLDLTNKVAEDSFLPYWYVLGIS